MEDISAQVVALVTGYRAGMPADEVARMAGDSVIELAESPDQVPYLLSQVIGHLVVLVAFGFAEWGAAAGGDPGGALLAIMGQMAAEKRSS